MRIQHNISALNAANRLKANDNAISKNIAKLSSGYRINNAADDAAGLAVSEKMRAQINGLNQAQSNAENGISLVQTAEGGLNETEAILQRMNTLAVESANGTYQDSTDRANLNKEVVALQSEIDRISTSTNFNQINLLDGSLGGKSSATATAAVIDVGAVAVANTSATKTSTEATLTLPADGTHTYTVTYQTASGAQKSVSATLNISTTDKQITDADGNVLYTSDDTAPTATELADVLNTTLTKDKDFRSSFNITDEAGALTFASKTAGTSGEKIVSVSLDGNNLVTTTTQAADAYDSVNFADDVYDGENASSAVFTVNGQKFAFVGKDADASGLGSGVNKVFLAGTTATSSEVTQMSKLINDKTGLATDVVEDGTIINFKAGEASKAGGALTFQIGSDNKDDQRVGLAIADMSSKGLGVAGVSIATQDEARAAIDTVKTAINTVSATRADLGALQNRLEHTTNNLSTMSENLTSAESSIRDVDMADEYVQYSKNQILSQAATAMLTQANAQPQNVLSLLKG